MLFVCDILWNYSSIKLKKGQHKVGVVLKITIN